MIKFEQYMQELFPHYIWDFCKYADETHRIVYNNTVTQACWNTYCEDCTRASDFENILIGI